MPKSSDRLQSSTRDNLDLDADVDWEDGLRWGPGHVMVRVEDADRALVWYTRKLEHRTSDMALSLELTYNYSGKTYTNGDAWEHLAIPVPDVEYYWYTLVGRVAREYRPPDSSGATFTKDSDGHEIELIGQ